jgi:hypothetical protein
VAGLGGHQPTGRLEPVHSGHPDVHQNHVGMLLPRPRDGFPAVRGLPDDLDVGLCLED